MKPALVSILPLFVLLRGVSSSLRVRPRPPVPPPLKAHPDDPASSLASQVFNQLLDHDDPSKGTFKQRYWVNDQWWAGARSPFVLFTPGESSAEDYTGYLTDQTITGLYAQEVEGAVVMLEHRYWGESSPYEDLNTETLQYLTLRQSIADLTYFAKNVKFSFDSDHSSDPSVSPWVLSGGSYSGALSAWTFAVEPGTFWAYHASSAPVEAIWDYWQYFYPVQQGLPANCSRDAALVIDHVDSVLASGDANQITALKTMFGLESVEEPADFASALMSGPWSWQDLEFDTGYSSVYEWCDSIEGVTAGQADVPGAEGVGLQTALSGYAAWIKASLSGTCEAYGYKGENNLDCLNTYNPNNLMYKDYSPDNAANIQWEWMVCNELGYWQDGAPQGTTTIVSRYVTGDYWQQQCPLYFPTEDGHSVAATASVLASNTLTQGWDLTSTTRVLWVNGQYDPWRSASVSSEFRPGGPLGSTTAAPIELIPDGVHCYDLLVENAQANSGMAAILNDELGIIKGWVNEFYTEKGTVKPTLRG